MISLQPATGDIQFLDDIVTHWAIHAPSALAVEQAHDGQDMRWSWHSLAQIVTETVEALRAVGVRPGDRVVVVAENAWELVALLFALSRLRAWSVCINARLSEREVEAISAHCGARCRLFTVGVSPAAQDHATRCQAVPLAVATARALPAQDAQRPQAAAPIASRTRETRRDGDTPQPGAAPATFHPGTTLLLQRVQFVAGVADTPPEPVLTDSREQVAALVYTTGTTGEPKGVMLTHANLLGIAATSSRLRRLGPQDRVCGVLPISHVYGLASVTLGSLYAGARLRLVARFEPAALLQLLQTARITVLQGVPALYARLLEALRATPLTAPLALRFLYAGGSPLDLALKESVEAAFGLPLHNGYGLTECSPTVSQTRIEAVRSDTSVGPVIPGVEVRIVDATGQDLPDGQDGELWVRGPNVMRGYYRDPEATAAVMRPGGWLNTGDMARRDPDGALFIVGRTRELIIRSGFNVFPVEVEGALNAHPAIRQSAVVGRVLPDGNEEVIAFIELLPGHAWPLADLHDHLAQRLSPYKIPADIRVLPALPAAPTGKILKGVLRRQVAPAVTANP